MGAQRKPIHYVCFFLEMFFYGFCFHMYLVLFWTVLEFKTDQNCKIYVKKNKRKQEMVSYNTQKTNNKKAYKKKKICPKGNTKTSKVAKEGQHSRLNLLWNLSNQFTKEKIFSSFFFISLISFNQEKVLGRKHLVFFWVETFPIPFILPDNVWIISKAREDTRLFSLV